jgi:hypothetical protein
MQISSFAPITGIVGDLCVTNCNVPNKISVTNRQFLTAYEMEYKNFAAATESAPGTNIGGFKTSTWKGQFTWDDFSLKSRYNTDNDHLKLAPFIYFMMEETKRKDSYTSE